ncbi:MAG: polysaccharide pyruvyl transferase family protein [Bacteroidales bacterium]|nr:polysaccharide pyruvyl transferase family protein [Bacteroidales bacterium]
MAILQSIRKNIKNMSSKIISHFILRLKLKFAYWKAKANDFVVPYSEREKCYFFLAADYGNLGDVAITYAQTEFLSERFPNAEIIEIPISKTFAGIKAIKRIVKKDDIITIVGGGNMGDMYDDIEFLRQLVIKSFKNNRIISFPQTLDFSKTLSGRFSLAKAKRIYSSHPNLTILARESVSYHLMKHHFYKNDIKLVPDIVMTLDERQTGESRKGVILCLRNDSEKKTDVRDEIVKLLETSSMEYKDYDTHIGRGNLSQEERLGELHKIWSAFSHSELVITDRLHGMIFAFITGTPAIVFPNSNFKIHACYEWIKDCGYIKFVEESTLGDSDDRLLNDFNMVHNSILQRFNNIFCE